MPTIAWEEVSRVDAFVRSDLPAPAKRCRQNTTARLEALVTSGVIDEFSVTSWAKRVPREMDSAVGEAERDLFRTFRSWARTTGTSLTPFFDTRECYSWTTGERQTQLVLPAVCLALYDGDELVAVAPHADESGSVGVSDCLDRLAETVEDEPSVRPPTAD